MSSNSDTTGAKTIKQQQKESLPPLTPFEERRYSAVATKMQYFHDHLQSSYETSYELADGSFNRRGMSLKNYLDFVDEFREHLTMHHDIEEAHVFPVLAKRMPEFRPNERHKNSHKLIHDGLDKIEVVINAFRAEPSSYKPDVMKEALDSFREPLYTHLAEEVRDLGAENMRKYWTMEEIASFRF